MVSENRNLLKSLICIMVPLFVIVSLSSSVSFADEDFRADNAVVSLASDSKKSKKTKETDKTKKTRVVVSMGDSYSAGEGIYPFYGSRDSNVPELYDWLAHRSRLSWPGQLYLDNSKDLLLNHKATDPKGNKDSLQWYFVAVSGAEVRHIKERQNKKYSLYAEVGSEKTGIYMPAQEEILKKLKAEGIVPDYITMSMGGNDLGFESIVETAAMSSSYLKPCDLADSLTEATKHLDTTTSKDLYNAYNYINATSEIDGKQPCILIVGYPRLFDESGSFPFDKNEENMINSSVNYFNLVIQGIVKKCKDEGLNIEFVDVSEAFDTHGACSSVPWINSVLGTQSEDLDFDNPISSYSIHPNKTGAKDGYRYCVQKKINELEKLNAEPTPAAKNASPGSVFPMNCQTGFNFSLIPRFIERNKDPIIRLIVIIFIVIIAARVTFGKRKRKDKE